MRNPVAVFTANQLSSISKFYCAYGTPTSIAWDTADIATLIPTTIHAEGDQILCTIAKCAGSPNEIVAAISGGVRIYYLWPQSLSVYFTRFYRSTDGGVTWSFCQMAGGLGKAEYYLGSYRFWYDQYRCFSMIYSDIDEKYYALMDHWEKATWAATPRSRLEIFTSVDGQTWALESAVTAWQYSLDEWFQLTPHSSRDNNLAVDTNGYVYIAHGGGNVTANLVVWKSTNAGASWTGPTTVAAEDVMNPTNSVCCVQDNVVITQGSTYYWQTSQDGGSSWQATAMPTNISGNLSVHDSAGHHTWMYNADDVTTERWTSIDVATGTPPAWAMDYQCPDDTWGYASCKSDATGLEDHVVAGCRKDGNSLVGVLLDRNVPLSTPIWTVATGLTLYAVFGFDVTGYSEILLGGYTYFF